MIALALALQRGGFRLEVDLCLPGTGVTAIIGPSGAGKTSLVAAVAGVLRPSRGLIRVGEVVFLDSERGIDLPVEERGCGIVFQDGRLFPHLSVARNLDYGFVRRRGRAVTQSRDRVTEMLGIAHLTDRYPQNLSGGERQRVAIGRALLSQPHLLLLDEPLSAVDPDRKGEILPYLERLHEKLDLPIILVSHAVEDVLRLAAHVVVLDRGEVRASGAAAAVLSRHALAGERRISVLEGRVEAPDEALGLTRIATAAGPIKVPGTGLPAGAAVRIVIGARDVVLARDEPHGLSIRNQFRGRVSRIERLDEAQACVVLTAGEIEIGAIVTMEAVVDLALAPGVEAWCLVKAAALDRPPGLG